MRLVSLNVWGGIMYDNLIQFIGENKNQTDVFCFQEVFSTSTNITKLSQNARADIYKQIEIILGDEFVGYNRPAEHGCDFDGVVEYDLHYGQAAFMRKSFHVIAEGEISTASADEDYKDFLKPKDQFVQMHEAWTTPGNLQYLIVEDNGKKFVIMNTHGLWVPQGKGDNELRFEQSRRILKLIKELDLPTVLVGDLNLKMDNKSLRMLEEQLANLIKLHNVQTTRSVHYAKPYKFADYALVSNEIKVLAFEVPNSEASDHLPLILDFTI